MEASILVAGSGLTWYAALLIFHAPPPRPQPLMSMNNPFKIYFVGHIKLLVSVIKYYPQVRLNYINKSTRGWAIHKCVLDFTGSVLSLCQLFIDASLTPGGISNAFRNPVKMWLGCISMGFEMVFMVQHWVLYPSKRRKEYEVESSIQDDEATSLLSHA